VKFVFQPENITRHYDVTSYSIRNFLNRGFGSLQETMYGRLMSSAVKKRSVGVHALNAVCITRGICRQ
jgi:hypothetical protein